MKVKEIVNNIIQWILISVGLFGAFSGLEKMFFIAIVISGVYGRIIMFIAFAKGSDSGKCDAQLFLLIIDLLLLVYCLCNL